MTILFAASEMAPFCKTGGLADVVGALPQVLVRAGHHVIVVLPGYSTINRAKYGFVQTGEELVIPVGMANKRGSVSSALYRGVDVRLLECDAYYDRPKLYGDGNKDYADNAERFIFFARGVIEIARRLGVPPSIIHAHDWQTGLIPAYLATIHANDPFFSRTATLFTIHNLGYQGLFPLEMFPLTGLPESALDWRKMEFWGEISFLKAGLIYADGLSAVSETYAEEITRKPLGFGMHGVFAERKDALHGIVNGIDQDEWDPAADMVIPHRFAPDNPGGKEKCRKSLAHRCCIETDDSTPIIGMVARLDDQKGIDIFEEAADDIIEAGARIVVLGTGSDAHESTMHKLERRHRGKFRPFLEFSNDLARMIYAGSDAFLMPSRYEPCGLGQLIAMRYGALPIVHATGGLKDTVRDLDDDSDGDGFVFTEYSADALTEAVGRAVTCFREPDRTRWNAAVGRVMARDFSWDASALRYTALYEQLARGKAAAL